MLYRPEYIIIHHSLTKDSQTVSWSAIRKYHIEEKGWRDIGYHYGIEQVGNVLETFIGRFEGHPGAHTRGHNRKSIGICLVGNYDLQEPSPEKWNLLIRLTKNIIFRHDIPFKNVCSHRRFASYKSCPGTKFDFHKFKEDLSRQL